MSVVRRTSGMTCPRVTGPVHSGTDGQCTTSVADRSQVCKLFDTSECLPCSISCPEDITQLLPSFSNLTRVSDGVQCRGGPIEHLLAVWPSEPEISSQTFSELNRADFRPYI
ncbi:hypothetical protein BVI1335_990016 [Burkholderia vietnamiensis]|nr:hypothetical protein BVI1335_990016 [Burkholderia vietnamiensis]